MVPQQAPSSSSLPGPNQLMISQAIPGQSAATSQSSQVCDEALSIELLQLATLLVKNMKNDLDKHRKVLTPRLCL